MLTVLAPAPAAIFTMFVPDEDPRVMVPVCAVPPMVMVPEVIALPKVMEPAVWALPILTTLAPLPLAKVIMLAAELEPTVMSPVPAPVPIRTPPFVAGVKTILVVAVPP